MSETTPSPSPAGGDAPPVFVFNVPGIDRRRLDPASMPFLHKLIEDHAVVEWDGHPTTEIWPTMVTGVNPGVHNIWHCELDDQGPPASLTDKLLCALPDKLVSTLQLFRHFADRDFDMPCIPHWRRRHLAFTRLKYNNRSAPEQYRTVGGVETVFGVLGDDAHYCVTGKFEGIADLLATLPVAGKRLQWFEVHAYDIAVHYSVNDDAVMARRGKEIDDLAKTLYERCREQGIRFVLVVDHGQEPVAGSVNLNKALKRSGVSTKDYVYFTAVGVAKFWFRTDAAREKITRALQDVPHLNLMTHEEMNQRFEFELGPEWGELYAVTDNDHVFFPHDFHHLLAHLHLGLTNSAMRGRLTNFNMAAYHGLMPGHPAELGFMVAADPALVSAVGEGEWVQIKDVAPTLLEMVGADVPPHMDGRAVLVESATQQAPASQALSA